MGSRIACTAFLVFFALTGFLLPSPFPAHGKELLIATDGEKRGGYLVEITKAALKRTGYTADIHFLPWKRALLKSMKGNFDILLGAYHTEERAAKMAYSEPLANVDIVLLTLKSHGIKYSNLRDLAEYKIGHIRGGTVSKEFDTATYLQIEEAATIDQNLHRLLTGKVTLIVDKKQQLLYLIRTQYPEFSDKVELLAPPLRTTYFFNAFPKNRPDALKHLKDFNQGLKALKADGTYTRILEKHGIGN